MHSMIFLFCSDVVITHPINLQVSFIFFIVHLILGLSASSLVTLQSRLMCRLCKPFPPRKPHILLVVLLCITDDHTHLKVEMHPTKTMHPEIILSELAVLNFVIQVFTLCQSFGQEVLALNCPPPEM